MGQSRPFQWVNNGIKSVMKNAPKAKTKELSADTAVPHRLTGISASRSLNAFLLAIDIHRT
jgi:hypothetical protein